MENEAKNINAYLVEHIGTDSQLYRRLNSDQREAIKSVYQICNAYAKLLGKEEEPLKPDPPAPPAPPVEEPAQETNEAVWLVLPAILSAVGAFAAGLLWWPGFRYAAGICAALLGGIGAGGVWLFKGRGSGRERAGVPATPESEPEPAPGPAPEPESESEQIISAVRELMEHVGYISRPKDTGYDIQRDVRFATWVQKVMSSAWNEDDRYLRVLVTDELDTRLSGMGFFVCTEPEMEDGRLIAPYDNLFVVKYKEVAEPTVTLPAICLDEVPVVRGEILLPK